MQNILILIILATTSLVHAAPPPTTTPPTNPKRPNILFFFADDWGRYASIYRDPNKPSLNDIIHTPNIDRIAREGLTFNNAFVPVASCGPCRASLATASYFWRCGSGAFLNSKNTDWSNHTNPFTTMPKWVDHLAKAGYHTQRSGKTFAFTPTRGTGKNRSLTQYKDKFPRYGLYVSEATNPADQKTRHNYVIERSRNVIQSTLLSTPQDKPFFLVFGPINVHRPYIADSGQKLWNINPDSLKGLIPSFLPDVHDVRRDFADYLGEVLALDLMLGVMLDELEAAGQLDNTLIILSGDHGIPGVPRGKTNCYDLSIRVPLIMRLPKTIQPNRTVDDFVSLMDLGPTLLEFANAPPIPNADGRSFLKQITSKKSGWIDPTRNSVIVGRERHVSTAREGNIGYPMRAIRNKNFLYIKNFKPDRWPAGDPFNLNTPNEPTYDELHNSTFATMIDLDASLTKAFMFTHRADKNIKPLYDLTLGKRPTEELYDIANDPDQLHNLATNPNYASTLQQLREQVDSTMKRTNDPRLNDAFDFAPYVDPKP